MSDKGISWLAEWLSEFLAQEQQKNPDLKQVIDWCSDNTMPEQFPKGASNITQSLWAQRHSLLIQEDILYRKWHDVKNSGAQQHLQAILPAHLKECVLRQLHDHLVSGAHLGQHKTTAKIQGRFDWVGQRKDMQQWCEKCVECAARKNPPCRRRASLGTVSTAYPFQVIALDIHGSLPTTKIGSKYVLVIGDYFSKWTEAFPIIDMEAKTVAKVLIDEFICRFGTPEQIHTDEGRNFESELFQELCSILSIQKTRTTPYHSQSDGMIERFNRNLLNILSINTSQNPENWDEVLPKLMCGYRTSIHESTKQTPFSLIFGREIRLPIDVMFGLSPTTSSNPVCKLLYVADLRRHLEASYALVRKNLVVAHERQKTIYDQKRERKVFPSRRSGVVTHALCSERTVEEIIQSLAGPIPYCESVVRFSIPS